MVSDASLQLLSQWSGSLGLDDRSQEEMAACIASIRALQPSTTEKILAEFERFKGSFSVPLPTSFFHIIRVFDAVKEEALGFGRVRDINFMIQQLAPPASVPEEEVLRKRALITSNTLRLHYNLNQIDLIYTFLHRGVPYDAWHSFASDGSSVINIGIAKFYQQVPTQKVSVVIDGQGCIRSILLDGQPTKYTSVPPEWSNAYQELLQQLSDQECKLRFRARELTVKAESLNASSVNDLRYFPYSSAVIRQLIMALSLYSRGFALHGYVTSESCVRLGDEVQSNTVIATFKAALDPQFHGGVVQTIESIERADREGNLQGKDDLLIADFLKQTLEFLRELAL